MAVDSLSYYKWHDMEIKNTEVKNFEKNKSS